MCYMQGRSCEGGWEEVEWCVRLGQQSRKGGNLGDQMNILNKKGHFLRLTNLKLLDLM